jgi:nuclear RNA export factor
MIFCDFFVIFSSKGSLTQYMPECRNFLKFEKHRSGRNRHLHKGRENIVNFLEKLPKTKHDLGSFIVDVPLANVSSEILILFKFCQ